MSLEADRWICHGCMREHHPVDLVPGAAASCERCGERLRVNPRADRAMGLVWALTALGLFLTAMQLPILEVHKAGLTGEASVLVAQTGLRDRGMPLLGFLSGAMVFWLPLAALLLLVVAYLASLRKWRSGPLCRMMTLLRFVRTWAMPEVFLLAVLVAFLKVGDLARTTPESGLWFLVAATAALLVSFSRLDRDGLIHELSKDPARRPVVDDAGPPLALLLAALILLIPANMLPIMEVRMPGSVQASTILGGVRTLLDHRLWGIAAIVFVASILVPFAKILGLFWLLWRARQRHPSRQAMTVYRVLEAIGRWSMLDVFLVALLSGLIQFGRAAEVYPGPAAPAFAAAVILTALAVEQFDPRRLWLSSARST